MSKTNLFTAQDARNITEKQSSPSLGRVIDIIRDAAKRGYQGINLTGANIAEETLDTLTERGFDVDVENATIGWGIKPEQATAVTDEDTVATMEVVTDEEE